MGKDSLCKGPEVGKRLSGERGTPAMEHVDHEEHRVQQEPDERLLCPWRGAQALSKCHVKPLKGFQQEGDVITDSRCSGEKAITVQGMMEAEGWPGSEAGARQTDRDASGRSVL